MRSAKSLRPSPALVVSIIALVVATAGTTYALTVPKKSVGTKQLKAKAVTAKKLGATVRRSIDVTVRDGLASPPVSGGALGHAGCRRGERLISGGAKLIPDQVPDVPINASYPGPESIAPITHGEIVESGYDQVWTASAHNPYGGSGPVTMRIFAICLQ